MLLKDLIQITPTYEKEVFGVEVEMEGRSLWSRNFSNWKVAGDGSLQGGLEYVLREPKDFDSTLKDVESLYYKLKLEGATLNPSIRAGVHVHYNVGHWTVLEFVNFMCTYLTLENIMIRNFAGPGRFGNLFCIPASRAEVYTNNLIDFFKTKDSRLLGDENIRYSALNLNSLFKYGTIEFRSLGTSSDTPPLIRWITIIKNLVRWSLQFNDPQDILNNFSNLIDKDYVSNIFGYPVENLEKQDFYEGVEQAQLLAFMTTNWDEYIKTLEEQKPKRNIKPKYINDMAFNLQAGGMNLVRFDEPIPGMPEED